MIDASDIAGPALPDGHVSAGNLPAGTVPAGNVPAGTNGGPPLDDDAPPWGRDGIGNYFEWAAAKKKAFDAPYDIAMMRVRRADALGLTYEEYTLEILERGRYLSAADADRIAEIKRRRPIRY